MMIAYLPAPLPYFQHHIIPQDPTLLLGQFQLRLDLSQAWLHLNFVSYMQHRVPNLYPKIDSDDRLLTTSTIFPTLKIIKSRTILLGRFQLRSDLSQAWNIFLLVSDIQQCIHSLVLNIVGYNDCLLAMSTIFLTPQNNTAGNSLTGWIPTEIGSLTNLTYLYFRKWRATTYTQSCSYEWWLFPTFHISLYMLMIML